MNLSTSTYTFSDFCQLTFLTLSSGDLLASTCFFSGGVVYLGALATYHMVPNHWREMAMLGNLLDY